MDDSERNELVAKMRQDEQDRLAGYREQALKLFPHVCGRCTREFSGKNLRELTVHHKDHNHDNNPLDGRNWELLCLYCHDHEHTRSLQGERTEEEPAKKDTPNLVHSPFAQLKDKLKPD